MEYNVYHVKFIIHIELKVLNLFLNIFYISLDNLQIKLHFQLSTHISIRQIRRKKRNLHT